MLATTSRPLFRYTLVTALATWWFFGAFVVVIEWPIITVTTIVPPVAIPWSSPIVVSHFTSPVSNGKVNYTPQNNNVNSCRFFGISDKVESTILPFAVYKGKCH